ncbi:MAG: AAA family ATPase [Dehalococcoidia bacterium]|nr:AAA family ATPase [Dehalococcoidia bacterium]
MDEQPNAIDQRTLSRGWQGVLGRLELEINRHNYATWLAGTRALRIEGTALIVQARSVMTCDWLNRQLRVVIERAAMQAFPSITSVQFVVPGEAAAEPVEAAAPAAYAAPTVVGIVNPHFTFDGYVTANGNLVAVRSCEDLLAAAEQQVSPVVVYGPPGMGKTHLLHAVAGRARDLGRRVACLNADDFTNRFYAALKSGRGEDFKAAVRAVDLLIIDDLQSLATKKAAVDELVNTMEEVTNSGGHIVIASERSPFELGLPERLESRLAAGIVTRVERFDCGEQRAFVEAIARRRRVSLPGWAIDRIAATRASSVRELLGRVHEAIQLERLGRLDMAALDARVAGNAVVEAAQEHIRHAALLTRVATYFDVASESLRGRDRGTRVSTARAVAAAALKLQGASVREIGELLDGRDPSTIQSLSTRGKKLIAEDTALAAALSLVA